MKGHESPDWRDALGYGFMYTENVAKNRNNVSADPVQIIVEVRIMFSDF